MKKIKGIKKAIDDYKRANSGGTYSPFYGRLMFDKSSGEIWCDEFCNIGHNEYKQYKSPDIINIGAEICAISEIPTMQTVKAFCSKYYNYC